MRAIAEGIGWIVIIMFVLGALDIANFRLSFKAKDTHVSIHDNTIINCERKDDEHQTSP